MKIGLVSDIHGHTEPFKQALDLFERLSVDQIICAGDLVDFHSQKAAHEVIEILRTRQIPCVKGNHDAWWLENEQSAPLPPQHQMYLSSEDKTYLASLPLAWQTEWEGLRIYMTHASPSSLVDGLYFRNKEYIRRAVESANADIMIVGHTHLAAHIQFGQTHIYNPGAVWSEFTEENATCAVLTLPDLFFQVYDLRTDMLRMVSSVIM